MDYWIVVVDDEAISLTNVRTILSAEGMKVSCMRSGHDLLKYVEKHTPDLILMDILMPEMDGFETFTALRQFEEREGRSNIPVVFLSGESDSETERRGLNVGASDYIHKPFDKDILINRIVNTVKNSRTIESLTEDATIDKLTGLLNKASGTQKVTKLCESRSGTLMIFDLDNFKLVNDIYGHDMGDRVLASFAEIIKSNIRSDDLVCRIGGDEFMGFFSNLAEESAVSSLTHRLNEQLMQEAEKLMGKEHDIPLGISVGAALIPEHARDYNTLFQYADSSLYRVKQNGKHGYSVYSPLVETEGSGEDLEKEITRIISIVEERGEGKGALMLGQEAFSRIYQFMIRFLKCYGGDASGILFSLSANEQGVNFLEAVTEFGTVIERNLRSSDIVFQNKSNQFFVMLPMQSGEGVPVVIGRIVEEWKKTEYCNTVSVKYATEKISF